MKRSSNIIMGVAGGLAAICCIGTGIVGAVISIVPVPPARPAPSSIWQSATPERTMQTSHQPSATAVASPSPVKVKVVLPDYFSDGMWVVGEDIQPGTYKVVDEVTSGLCYWAILRSGSNGSDIVSNDIVTGGYPRITVRKGQDVKTSRCGTWTKVNG